MVCDEVFTNSAEYGIISQRDFFDKDIANSENIDGYYIVEPNDFVYNPRISNLAPFGPIRRNKLEKSGAMSPLYYVFRTHGVDYGFLEYYFKTNGWHSFMHLNGNSGARSDRFAIRDDVFREMPITMPQNVVEQQAIGKYFTNLDNLITLHQRKYSFLFIRTFEILKEACFFLNVNAWEQREFSDIAETRRGLTYKPNSIVDNGVRVLRSSNINEDTFVFGNDDVFVDENAVNIPYIQNGDILITSANGSSRLVGKHAIIRNLPDNSAVHGGFMLIASSSNPEFLNASMSSQWYSEFVSLYVAGGNGAIGNLNKNDLDTQIVFVPSVAEQQQIGSYFRNLDNLITLHQRKPCQRKNGGKNYVRRC